MTNSVADKSPKSLSGSPALKKIRDLRGGVDAMRKAGEVYLPKEERESNEDYISRKNRSWLFPALDKAIEDVADRVFAKEVAFGEDVDAELLSFAENIDSDGRKLNNFARDVFEDGVEAGIAFILVDSPQKSSGMTRAEARKQNIRPYMIHVKAEDVLGWKTTVQNNKTVLSMVRIWETVEEDDPNDKFSQISVDQVRVLELVDGKVVISIYRRGKNAKWEIFGSPIFTDMEEIPLVPFYTNRTGFFTAKPRYEKLADLNIAHWQSASDQRNILHTARVPLLVLFGMKAKDVEASPNSAIITERPKTEADVKYVEHAGAAIEAGEKDLEKLEQRMQVLGIELAWKPVANTGATGAAIDHGKVMTPLAMMANNLKDSLEQALCFMARYKGRDEGGSVSVNTDFGISLLSQGDLQFLLNAVNTGQISHATFLKECQRRNVLMDDIDPSDEKELIDKESPKQVDFPGIEDGE
ncbi:DUF4055 domain-containing protein [Pelagimonas sp. KU-00592-HH]|uniref:DUF4055 domain-containing protein n=1 Tax=Pelagimonas sp. KU-00592-HH TaxID=3127651 RepID=UPI003107E760